MEKLDRVSNSTTIKDFTSSNATVVIVETPPLGGDEKTGQHCVSAKHAFVSQFLEHSTWVFNQVKVKILEIQGVN